MDNFFQLVAFKIVFLLRSDIFSNQKLKGLSYSNPIHTVSL